MVPERYLGHFGEFLTDKDFQVTFPLFWKVGSLKIKSLK